MLWATVAFRPFEQALRSVDDPPLGRDDGVQFPFANDLDHPEPEIIPAGFGDAAFYGGTGGAV